MSVLATPTAPPPVTLAQAIPDELERVIILRETYRLHAEVTQQRYSARADWARPDFSEAITRLTAVIDSAKAALASGDVLHLLQVHAQLGACTDDR